VPASEYRALQSQIRELQQLPTKRHWKTRFCARRWIWRSQKTLLGRAVARRGTTAVNANADALGEARSNLASQAALCPIVAAAGRSSPRRSC
jgi:hypothetical protein